MNQVITIDGPVASGKTTVGRKLSEKLGFRYLDTGVMYRAITWLALEKGLSVDDEASLGRLAELHPISLPSGDSSTVLIAGRNLGSELRGPAVVQNVSQVSKITGVRRALVAQQRALAAQGRIVVVGRDIGTVVLPDARVKIYITASPEVRARRRWQEMKSQGQNPSLEQVLQETQDRDRIDSQRADSPLKPAEDAWIIDTDELSAEEVTELIRQRFKQETLKTSRREEP